MVSCRVDVGGSSGRLEVYVQTRGATVDPAVLRVHDGPGEGHHPFLHPEAVLTEHLHVAHAEAVRTFVLGLAAA